MSADPIRITRKEFVHDQRRERMERLEAARIRDAILEGYQDLAQGRTAVYCGNLRRLLK